MIQQTGNEISQANTKSNFDAMMSIYHELSGIALEDMTTAERHIWKTVTTNLGWGGNSK